MIDERRIIPIVRHDNDVREYWVEVRRSARPGEIVTDVTPYTSLVRFYDYEDLLDQPGATKPQGRRRGRQQGPRADATR